MITKCLNNLVGNNIHNNGLLFIPAVCCVGIMYRTPAIIWKVSPDRDLNDWQRSIHYPMAICQNEKTTSHNVSF